MLAIAALNQWMKQGVVFKGREYSYLKDHTPMLGLFASTKDDSTPTVMPDKAHLQMDLDSPLG